MIQIDSQCEKLQEYFDSNQLVNQKTSQDFDSNHDSEMTNHDKSWLQKSSILIHWFESSHDSMIRINCWFCWPFSGFHSISLTFFGLSLSFADLFWALNWVPWFESGHGSSSITKTWVDSTRDSSDFPWIDSESTHDSSGFPRFCFRLTHDSKCFPISRFNSTHDSSKKHLILSRLMLRLWVIPMSAHDPLYCGFHPWQLKTCCPSKLRDIFPWGIPSSDIFFWQYWRGYPSAIRIGGHASPCGWAPEYLCFFFFCLQHYSFKEHFWNLGMFVWRSIRPSLLPKPLPLIREIFEYIRSLHRWSTVKNVPTLRRTLHTVTINKMECSSFSSIKIDCRRQSHTEPHHFVWSRTQSRSHKNSSGCTPGWVIFATYFYVCSPGIFGVMAPSDHKYSF